MAGVKFAVGVIRHYAATVKHKGFVGFYLLRFCAATRHPAWPELLKRALAHDLSKFRPDEAEGFARVIRNLKRTPYGSPEYKRQLDLVRPSIALHYARNRHHPEFHKHGFRGMTDVDRIELVADWAAAVRRHDNGNLSDSIVKNRARFSYGADDELELRTYARRMGLL